MSARRKAVRERDLVSYGRRTPRFDFVRLRAEVRESAQHAELLAFDAGDIANRPAPIREPASLRRLPVRQ